MELIPLTKDGEYIEVHPTALAQHKVLGWMPCVAREVVDDDTIVYGDVSDEKRKPGRPRKVVTVTTEGE